MAAPEPTLGQQLDDLMQRMDAATKAWAEAGHPFEGPVAEAREAVFVDLRAFNERCAAAGYGPASKR